MKIEYIKKGIYLSIKSTAGKEYIFDKTNLKLSKLIYQPSSFKGKFLLLILNFIAYFPLLYKFFHITKCNIELDSDLEKIIINTFNTIMSTT